MRIRRAWNVFVLKLSHRAAGQRGSVAANIFCPLLDQPALQQQRARPATLGVLLTSADRLVPTQLLPVSLMYGVLVRRSMRLAIAITTALAIAVS